MTTQDLLEKFLEEGYHAFKTCTAKRSPEIRKLIRHEPVMIDGVQYDCLQEYTILKIAEHIRSILPDTQITAILKGNDSDIELELTEQEQEILNSSLHGFLQENGCLD